jgi:hypothetical protein
MRLAPDWRDLRQLDDADLAAQTEADGIDIPGRPPRPRHSTDGSWCAPGGTGPHPDPHIGYASTTAMRASDSRITDHVAIPRASTTTTARP